MIDGRLNYSRYLFLRTLEKFWHNTLLRDTEKITIPVKYHESVFDLQTNVPQFFEPSVNEKLIRIVSEYIKILKAK